MENTVRNVGCEWLRSKQEKHGIIADLTGFDNLKAMLGAEDITRRRKGTLKTKKRKNYGYFQFQAQEDMPVNVAKVKGREATVVEGEKALTVDCTVNSAGLVISCSGTAEMVQVECSATKETEQKRIEKENVDTMVEMTQASATTNGVNSSIAIGVSLSSLEGNISFCRGVAETVPVETLTVNAMKQKRKVDRASKEMQEDTAKGMEREQVEFTDNIVLRQLLVIRYANARCGSGKRRNYASFVGVWITLRGVVERVDREENKRAISFCFKDLTENEKVHGIF
ncbi:hypothetical protein D5086_029143 [Populus alba]|uniref:Uncharacterized protein n=1 Tax=Populus alba TaxID=43335 RepID=A0ACC4AU00_POPAL